MTVPDFDNTDLAIVALLSLAKGRDRPKSGGNGPVAPDS